MRFVGKIMFFFETSYFAEKAINVVFEEIKGIFRKGEVPARVYVVVPPNSDLTVHASDLTNDLVNNHYLVCYNPSTLVEGLFTVEML